jgi:putative ABC transport system permease protein
LIRIASGDVSSTLTSLQAVWQRIAPDIPFTYSFLDDELQRQYHSEDRLGHVVTYAAVFAILIACIGLLGIVALAVAERTKEIGIRKVLGASVTRVTYLVCKDYVRLTALAALLALPVAYFTMRSWLEHFAYHVPLSFSVMVLACVLVVMAALLTVSYQAIKTALSDPVKALRYE